MKQMVDAGYLGKKAGEASITIKFVFTLPDQRSL